MRHLAISSLLPIPPQQFWDQQSLATVNFELSPWLRMTAPPRWRQVLLKDWQGTGPLFNSWILLLGWLPIDRHAFGTLHVRQQQHGFVEHSSSWFVRLWRHERQVQPVAQGCKVVDKISYVPRIPGLSVLLKPIYISVFRHRHRRLRQRYAGTNGEQAP